ncbi:MAG: FtsX-like permease family protein [candidate division WOR-3 bacterium]
MLIFNLAWRNVFRHTRRSIITAIAISVGLSAMVFMDTMMNGVDKMAQQNIIDYETGNLVIFAKGYYREEGFFPIDTIIENPQSLINQLKTIAGIKAIVPRVKFQSHISNGIDEISVLVIGIDKADEAKVFKTPKAVVKGSFLQNSDELLIGEFLARDLNLTIGSPLTVIARNRYGTYDAQDFIVTGIINTGHPLLDRNAVLIPIEAAQNLLAIENGVTELAIKSQSNNLTELKAAISQKLGEEYEVYTWRELNASIFEISGMKRAFQFLLALVVVIIAAVGIVNTMLMAVMERVTEIGTLKALGFSNGKILKMFLWEGTIIGGFGSLIGSLFGWLGSLYLVIYGIDLSGRFKDINIVYPIKFIIKGEINYPMMLFIFVFGFCISILVTLLTVRRVTRLEPISALRHL